MKELSPVDFCGCGDTGYLTKRTIPIDLAQGMGHIHQVPVYHCGSKLCDQYTLPSPVVPRIDDLADMMEQRNLNSLDFSWEDQEDGPQDSLALIEAFIWKFNNRKYEDATVVFIIPAQSIIFQSQLDNTEFYQLQYLQKDEKGTWFSLNKFYSDEPLTLEEFLDFEPTYTKELGFIDFNEVEDALIEEFGAII
ncbi:hypothetical protein [Desulfitobacterium metallireducens]|uniref:Uncharacterized protein n=1 Tax=Desulfitobacterium metallireducens DSM 15288 TaxID=871968 RepID=W0EC48_9FIRM|nr:hypothetical protein [Desulfitobacterium metallireducens]AHF06641.1 hypothetical protein DESME_05920 [Desulfitobacterium metallireducens DSM 15288]